MDDDVAVPHSGERRESEVEGTPPDLTTSDGLESVAIDTPQQLEREDEDVAWGNSGDVNRLFGDDEEDEEDEDVDEEEAMENTELHGPQLPPPSKYAWKMLLLFSAIAAFFYCIVLVTTCFLSGQWLGLLAMPVPIIVGWVIISALVIPTRRYHHVRVYLMRRWLRLLVNCWQSGCKRVRSPPPPKEFADAGFTGDDLIDDADLIVLDQFGKPMRIDTSAHWFALFHSALVGVYLSVPVVLFQLLAWYAESYVLVYPLSFVAIAAMNVMRWIVLFAHLIAVIPLLHVIPLDLCLYFPRGRRASSPDIETGSGRGEGGGEGPGDGERAAPSHHLIGLHSYFVASTTPRCTRGMMFGGALGAGLGCGLAMMRLAYAVLLCAGEGAGSPSLSPAFVSLVSTALDMAMYTWCGAWLGLTHTNHKRRKTLKMWKRIVAVSAVMAGYYWISGMLVVIAAQKTSDQTQLHYLLFGPFVFTQIHWVFVVSCLFSFAFIVITFCFLAAYHKYLLTDGYERLSMQDVGAAFSVEDEAFKSS